MITAQQCQKKYGQPELQLAMTLWDVPEALEVGVIPKRIYCNRDLIGPLSVALGNLIKAGQVAKLRTWDGCFNIRKKRGLTSPSLHSWGVAIDINAAWNPFGGNPTMKPEFVKCFTDAGFDWGGNWQKKDGMHFQLAKI
jgi:hypothetical protein